MKCFTVLPLLLPLLVTALSSVTIKGNAFFADNKRFYIRGVDYQPGGESQASTKDPIADINGCKRDIEYFKKLGINTIRVYGVDNSANHDECMKALSDAGIYLAVDVGNPKYSLNRENPYTIMRSYNDVYLQHIFATVDAFAKYDNTLLFFSGNEVISKTETWAAPYIKAVTRDLKQYIAAKNYRAIPVGYAATDVDSRYELANYLNCGSDDIRSDFLAFNDYSFCGKGVFKGSQWEPKVANLSKYSIPLFLSEYGCKEVSPRTFSEVPVLYSPDMTPVYSGGLIYEYSVEEAGFGLVKLSGNSVSEIPDFNVLKQTFQNTPLPSSDGGYHSSGQASACPPASANWKVNGSLPIVPQGALKYFQQGAGMPLGGRDSVNVNGSQWVGTPTTGWATAGGSGASSSNRTSKETPKKNATVSSMAPTLGLVTAFLVALAWGL
ncbi:hypothetical protein EJ08DRAFT_188215 [Tothia fuscella]|uniref:1,3-beta-glucanosyltransferase n=1 Tax=Tothia fuscella TaxID=1048955 RepID=A0A9P4TZI9_9PEZI|nr:hypothetical protein EJ08DRAFT_188215 [Tothia fuscella]